MHVKRFIGPACVAAFVASLAMSGDVGAEDIVKGDLAISQPWTRATPGGARTGAGYVTITNYGKSPDRLVGGSMSVAGVLEIHSTTMQDGVMRMRQLEKGIEIKPGETIVLKPGGIHLMLMELQTPLVRGERVRGTLAFERAGVVEVEFAVAPIGAASPDGASAKGTTSGHGNGHHHH